MRVAVVHSFYRSGQPSGENAIVLEQVEALKRAGHEVELIAKSSDVEFSQTWSSVRAGINVAFGTGFDPTHLLRNFEPEIVHVHNTFPNVSLKWLAPFRDRLVVTLHNYRTVCANGLLFRDGRVCLECVRNSSIAGLKHGCYRDSRTATLPLTIRNYGGARNHPVIAEARTVVCLSQGALDLFQSLGVSPDKLKLVPNGIDDPMTDQFETANNRWIFAGRLSSEKGIGELVEMWPENERLDVFGGGPLLADLQQHERADIRLMGAIERDELLKVLPRYSGLIFPSSCLEMQPTIILEALAAGVPIVARINNAGSEIVDGNNCGAVFNSSEELKSSLTFIRQQGRDLRQRCREVFQEKYSRQAWLSRQVALYYEILRGS